jgi:TonB-dependent receptor
VPSLIFPDVSTASGYPDSYTALHQYHYDQCKLLHPNDGYNCTNWALATYGTDPSGDNQQRERTEAGFGQVDFDFDDLKYPIDGNLGVRLVHTEDDAHGYTVFTGLSSPPPEGYTGVTVPEIAPFSTEGSFKNSYTDVLPSFNLRMRAGHGLQYRFAYSTGMTRPDFSQLQAYTTLSENYSKHLDENGNVVVDSVALTGTAAGNPDLKPIKSQNFDLSAEYYFSKAGSLTFTTFDKQLSDIIINQTSAVSVPDVNGNPQSFVVTSPVNGAKGFARGFEVGYQQYFDMLPGALSGLGMQANYTLVNSATTLYNPVFSAYCAGNDGSAANVNLNLNGCDTDGRAFGNLPIQGLSHKNFNFAILYDQGDWSARVAYSWRSKYLQNVNVNGTNGSDGTDTNPASATYGQHNVAWGLPTWADKYGELDASVFYKINDKLTVGLEGMNLTNTEYVQLMQQHVGMEGRAWFTTGARYSVYMRFQL